MRAKPTNHRRWLVRMAKEADRERLRRARAGLKQARALKRSAKARAREACATARVAVRQWTIDERQRVKNAIVKARAELKSAIARNRLRVRTTCSTGRLDARAKGDAQIAQARSVLEQEREQARLSRIWKGKGTKQPGRAREVRQESDDSVRANLSGDQLYVFEAVKARIKSAPRMSRTEAFEHWVHEHGGEVSRILEQQYAADVARMEREEKAARAAMRPRSYAAASEADLHARLASVTKLQPLQWRARPIVKVLAGRQRQFVKRRRAKSAVPF